MATRVPHSQMPLLIAAGPGEQSVSGTRRKLFSQRREQTKPSATQPDI